VAQVELCGVAVETLAGWSHPLRVRIGGEEDRLLGVRAKAARDAEGGGGGFHEPGLPWASVAVRASAAGAASAAAAAPSIVVCDE
jgi:hypothetical protein